MADTFCKLGTKTIPLGQTLASILVDDARIEGDRLESSQPPAGNLDTLGSGDIVKVLR